MKGRNIVTTTIIAMITMLVAGQASARRMYTKEEALKEMFPDADEVKTEVKAMTEEQIADVKKVLGGELVHYARGAGEAEIAEEKEVTFHWAMKGGEKTGVAVIDEQPGKWGPVEFIVALDPESGKVENLAVMSYSERRGRPIARRNFLRQFIGMKPGDSIRMHRDIRAISGATISSEAAAFAVKKVIALYDELYLSE